MPIFEIEKNQPYDVKTSVAIAAIIAAESRMAVLEARINDRTAYTDTDCLFLIGEGPLPEMDVDDTKLGSWKYEGIFTDGVFAGKKQYSFLRNGKEIVKTAGAPKNTFTWEEVMKVCQNNLEFTKVINKLNLDKNSMGLKYVATSITLKTNSTGLMKLYTMNDKGNLLYIGTLPIIINSFLEDNKIKTIVFNPKSRLTIRAPGRERLLTYEESLRYPTYIKGVKLPYKISGEFSRGGQHRWSYKTDVVFEEGANK